MNVVVTDITQSNFSTLYPLMLQTIQEAQFIALDTELSGIGKRRDLMAPSVDARYAALSSVAATRSILSLGISCFILKQCDREESAPEVGDESRERETDSACDRSINLSYSVYTFNIATLCEEDYVVEPGALRFLHAHGFDFNKQVAEGLPYTRGLGFVEKEMRRRDGNLSGGRNQVRGVGGKGSDNGANKVECEDAGDTEKGNATLPSLLAGEEKPAAIAPSVRSLFRALVEAKKPVVLHNAFVDLVFLYHNFYAPLPTQFSTFIADITLLFQGGVMDTKYVAEFYRREPASFLEYIFRKWQRLSERQRLRAIHEAENRKCTALSPLGSPTRSHHRFVSLYFPTEHGSTDVVHLPQVLSAPLLSRMSIPYCETFAAHGTCRGGEKCPLSHDLDVILDQEESLRKKRRRSGGKRQSQNSVVLEPASSASAGMRFSFESSLCLMHFLHLYHILCLTLPPPPPPVLHTHTHSFLLLPLHLTHPSIEQWSVRSNGHRAGFDAFMTGYCVAQCLSQSSLDAVFSLRNHVYLAGKPFPLMIVKSKFASYSPTASSLFVPSEEN